MELVLVQALTKQSHIGLLRFTCGSIERTSDLMYGEAYAALLIYSLHKYKLVFLFILLNPSGLVKRSIAYSANSSPD